MRIRIMDETSNIPALSFRGLVRKFKGFKLGPIDLDLAPGTVLGLIGPNGAGKTTTINTVVGLLKQNEGSIKIFGRETDPNDVTWKYDVGYVGDDHVFFEYWSSERNLKFVSQFYPNWSNDFALKLADRFQLDLKKRANRLSRGNRAKLALIMALAHNPRLLLLDEPSSGLDPVVRSEFLDVLYEINKKGDTAILYSTHILSDISRLADELIFIKEGNFILREKIDILTDNWKRISFEFDGSIPSLSAVTNHREDGKIHVVTSYDSIATIEHLTKIGASNIQISSMNIEEIAVEILKIKPELLNSIFLENRISQ